MANFFVNQMVIRLENLNFIYFFVYAGSGICPCFSEDDAFVSLFAKTGVDVWHLKSGIDRHGSDASLIMGVHR